MMTIFELDYFKSMIETLANDIESGRNSKCSNSKLNVVWIWRAYALCIQALSIPRFSKEQSLEMKISEPVRREAQSRCVTQLGYIQYHLTSPPPDIVTRRATYDVLLAADCT
jgi:hypothetical protein